MQDKDWTITKVSQEAPREWNNPKGGVVYYKKVMLEGWDKPVSVGKKSPDTLSVGMTIYGHPEVAAGMPEDKWKAGQNPNFGGGGFSSGSPAPAKRDWQPRDDDAIRAQWAIGQAVNALCKDGKEPNYDNVETTAKQLYAMVDRVKGSNGSSESTDPKASGGQAVTEPTTPSTTSKPLHKVNTKDPDAKFWPSDHEEDADFASLTAGLQADDIDLTDIPF